MPDLRQPLLWDLGPGDPAVDARRGLVDTLLVALQYGDVRRRQTELGPASVDRARRVFLEVVMPEVPADGESERSGWGGSRASA